MGNQSSSSPPPSYHLYHAGMTCTGCSSAITRLLTKIPNVEKVECDVEEGTVKVYGGEEGEVWKGLEGWGGKTGKEVRRG